MSSSEFDIIRRFFSEERINSPTEKLSGRSDVILGIGDDAAVLSPPAGQSLVVTTDTLISGVHFPVDTAPEFIGYKSLAVNLSDLAAMGAEPAWFTLSITLPESNERWLEKFSDGLFGLAQQYHIQLIGGDTTRGHLSITIQAIGLVPEGQALTRGGARLNDAVYVTGTIGDAAAGLKIKQRKLRASQSICDSLVARLERPCPRVVEGVALRGRASSAIDISDGLAADLNHVLVASEVGADILINDIPLSDAYTRLELSNTRQLAVCGGDDYELCFTVPTVNEQQVQQRLDDLGCRYTRIGTITSEPGLRWYDGEGNEVSWNIQGYDHFA